MVSIEKRIKAFCVLGEVMCDAASGSKSGPAAVFSCLVDSVVSTNAWFTPENVSMALESNGENLTEQNIRKWLSAYPALTEPLKPGNVAIVMAGNIPLVGLHDLLSVLITGNRAIARLSSKDELLMRAVAETLISTEPGLKEYIELTTEILPKFDAVIATGSDNTSRYFEYYFRNHPSVIRHNRNSVAVIDGSETDKELTGLASDIFSYFGLGCRNVSKLYLPEEFNISRMVSLWSRYENLRLHSKYAANYDHSKAVMIVNRQPFIDTGFVLLREDSSLTPPMAVVNYEFYHSATAVSDTLQAMNERIQCVTGHGFVPHGTAQKPYLWDYADDVDTIKFLLKNFSII